MLNQIDRHKVFISFKYDEHHTFKDKLLDLNEKYKIFEDWSVGNKEIDDTLPHEQIRRKIRDEFISDATVLILLNGSQMRKSKFIDWELQAAMTDYDNNPKMGILVINLPDNTEGNIDFTGEVRKIVEKNNGPRNWTSLGGYEELLVEYPNSPTRLLKNIALANVHIDMIRWDELFNNSAQPTIAEDIKILIDKAFKNRKDNAYDCSDALRRRAYQ